jgi:hypothetical protein
MIQAVTVHLEDVEEGDIYLTSDSIARRVISVEFFEDHVELTTQHLTDRTFFTGVWPNDAEIEILIEGGCDD